MKWKCGLVPKGKTCYYEQFKMHKCKEFNLRAALQQLKWSLPFGVGKRFKIYEHCIECEGWKCKKK